MFHNEISRFPSIEIPQKSYFLGWFRLRKLARRTINNPLIIWPKPSFRQKEAPVIQAQTWVPSVQFRHISISVLDRMSDSLNCR